MSSCARCGDLINESISAWTPTMPGELCERCLTGHEPGWLEMPVDEKPMTRRQRVVMAIVGFAACVGIGAAMASATKDVVPLVIGVGMSVFVLVAILRPDFFLRP